MELNELGMKMWTSFYRFRISSSGVMMCIR